LFARAGVASTSTGFCKYQVTLASNVWEPIYTVIGKTSAWGAWCDLYMNETNLRMEVTSQASPGFKYTLSATVAGNNLTWAIATDTIKGTITYINGIRADSAWNWIYQSGQVVTINSAFIFNGAITVGTTIAQLNTVSFPPGSVYALGSCGSQNTRTWYDVVIDNTGSVKIQSPYTPASFWSTWSISYIIN
jgi:hypothetical protein